ncbi:MAG: MATE family efflux transporter [Clostridia bacterium]|nr:MATE family efflux transporter [Clostridia bacterium]
MFKKFKENFIGDRDFYHRLLVLLIPMIIQQGITSFVSLLDNVMVGRLGTEAMSGVAIVNQLLFVFNLAIFGGLAGASIFGAQFYGKGDHEGVRAAFRFKMLFGTVMSVLAIAGLLLFGDRLIDLFLTDDGSGGDLALTLSGAKKYMLVMLIGLVPFGVSQSYSSTLRETGETVAPMTASVIAILTNLVLNWILIFGKLGAPALGVTGAAIATVISRYVEAIYLVIAAHAHPEKFEFIRGAYKSLRIPGDIAKKIIVTGTPLMLNELFWSIGTTMINQSYSTRGLTVVAATNIAGTAWNLFCIIMFAMGNAVSIMVGQQLGAGEIEEAKRTDNRLLFFTTATHVGVGILIAIAAPFIPLIYNTEPAVRELTTQLLLVDAAALPIHAYVHVTYFTIRSGGKTVITFLFDCLYTWVFPLPLAFFLCRYTALPMIAIFFCVQFIDIVKVIIGTALLRSGMWAKNLVADEAEAK